MSGEKVLTAQAALRLGCLHDVGCQRVELARARVLFAAGILRGSHAQVGETVDVHEAVEGHEHMLAHIGLAGLVRG